MLAASVPVVTEPPRFKRYMIKNPHILAFMLLTTCPWQSFASAILYSEYFSVSFSNASAKLLSLLWLLQVIAAMILQSDVD